MQQLLALFHRHWLKAAVVLAVLLASSTLAVSASVRERAHTAWHAVLSWAGLGGEVAGSGKVYWCPMHPQIKSTKENAICPICNMALVELGEGAGGEHLTLTAQQIQQAGVATDVVLRRNLYREIDTTGRIDYDERRLATITSWIDGKSLIKKLHVNYKGIEVKQGEPLAELYSPELAVSQKAYLLVLNDPALRRSARQSLKNQGLTDSQIDELNQSKQPHDRIPILAPISGTVHKLNVRQGQWVEQGDVVAELVDLSHLWVFADIFEEEVPAVKLGMSVEVSVQNLPDKTFRGEIGFIDHMVKPGTRTVPIRVDVKNEDHLLKAGMFARVRLRHEWPSVLSVPENAVLWSGQRAVVIVQHGEGTFLPQEVKLGKKWLYAEEKGGNIKKSDKDEKRDKGDKEESKDDKEGKDDKNDKGDKDDNDDSSSSSLEFGNGRTRYHEVLAGLAPGDKVVTSGAFLLNAESQLNSMLAKMLPPALKGVTLEEALGESVAKDMRDALEAYFGLVTALATDELGGVPKQIEALRRSVDSLRGSAKASGWEKLSEDATLLGTAVATYQSEPPKDLSAARRQFGDISHKLATLLSHHGGNNLMGKELFFFNCGMAKVGYERWLWRSDQIYNPYMGTKRDDGKMLDCGTKLDVLEP